MSCSFGYNLGPIHKCYHFYLIVSVHIENEKIFAESLEKLGNYSMTYEGDLPEIGKIHVQEIAAEYRVL